MCTVYELRMSASLKVTPLLAVPTVLEYAQTYGTYLLYSTYIRMYCTVRTYIRPHIHMHTFGNLADFTYGAAAVVLRESPSLPLSYVRTVHTYLTFTHLPISAR